MTDPNIKDNIINLFPEPVCQVPLRGLTSAELKYITSLSRIKNHGNEMSEETYVLDDPNLLSLKQDISTRVTKFYQAVSQHNSDTGLRLTQSWCNYTKEGEFHHAHLHPNSIISGVYYPQAEEGVDRITFYKNIWNQNHRVDAQENNHWNSESWWIPVQTGDLVLFNSNLRHDVPRKGKSERERISLSFNTFHTGAVGSRENLTEVILP